MALNKAEAGDPAAVVAVVEAEEEPSSQRQLSSNCLSVPAPLPGRSYRPAFIN